MRVLADPLQENLELHCAGRDNQKYEQTLASVLKSLKKTDKVAEALKISLEFACQSDLAPWRLKTLFLLSHFALEHGTTAHAVQSINSLYVHDSIGKEEYLRLVRLWEKMENTGLDLRERENIFIKGKKEALRAVQLEGLALYYVHLRSEGLTEEDAWNQALSLGPQVKKLYHPPAIFKLVREAIASRPVQKRPVREAYDESLWEDYHEALRL
ncbi:MAG: hypothetical protein RML34_11110 [Leptospiraceae bacterium]|nr:hypothetical protein [Leptospiraceae bacterium]